MFENYTFEYLMEQMLDRVPNTFDKREGSAIYNALAPSASELSEAYIMLDIFHDEMFIDTCSHDSLIEYCKSRGIIPTPATNAIVKGEFDIDIPIGSRFSMDALNFITIEKISTGIYKLECENTGPITSVGTLVPIEYIEGLQSAKITEILINGEEEETDESLRIRYYSSLDSQAFGGNIPDYKEKVNKLQDVGGCKVYPSWKGGGTVKVTIINSQFKVPSSELIQQVQGKVDPLEHQGEGVGIAPIGHKTTIFGVTETTVNIETTITYQPGSNFESARTAIEGAIDAYFEELNKTWADNENIVIRISQIETRLLNLEGILDIANTKLNDVASNLILDKDSIAKRGVISA